MTDSKIPAYDDSYNENGSDGIEEADDGYRFRKLNGRLMPPYVTPLRYAQSREVKMRESDISFCSFPKSGSTWLSQILLLLLNGGTNPDKGTLRQHMIWMEASWPFPKSLEVVDSMESPRLFKSHMPIEMALGGGPEKQAGKFIYIARNPKDVCVSYFHFETEKAWAGNFNCSWDDWFERFISGQVQRGSWFDHVVGWQREIPGNLLLLTYEDLLLKFESTVAKIADFLGIEVTKEVLRQIGKNSSFDAMKSSEFANMHEVEQLNTFYRKGKIGSWKEHFSESQNRRIDQLISERLHDVVFDFIYEAE